MNTSLNLLPPTDETITLVGEKIRGSGWYGHTNGLHTVAIRVLDFRGRVSVEATVIIEPTEVDWYSVMPDKVAFIQYPRPDYILPPNRMGETSTIGFNFATNAVWLRARMDRSYLIPSTATPQDIMPYGAVSYVMVNYAVPQRQERWTVPWI